MRKITLKAVTGLRKGIEKVMWTYFLKGIAEPRFLPMLKQFGKDCIALFLALCDLGLEKAQTKLAEE